jgi:tetratricopeptide (TPR) repeat protein
MLLSLLKHLRSGANLAERREAAKRALEIGDAQSAARLLEPIANGPSADSDVLLLAGMAQYRLGAYREALAHLERCAAAAPHRADARAHAAAARYKLGDAAGAKGDCERALALDPSNAAAHALLALIALPGPSYTRILELLHRALTPRTYVEIGVATGASLRSVQPTTCVVGIDPEPRLEAPVGPNVQIHAMPSDDYFTQRDVRADLGGLPIDLAFIDGAHVFDQALRDFINVERHSTRESIVLVHDTYPLDRYTAERTRQSVFWTGDVWRFVLALKKYRPDLAIANIAAPPAGLCLLRGLDPESTVLAANHDAIVEEFMAVDYGVLDADKDGMLELFPNDLERILVLAMGPCAKGSTPA